MTRISNRLLVRWLDQDQTAIIVDETSGEEAIIEAPEIPALIAALEYFASTAGWAPAAPTPRVEGDGPDPQVPSRPRASERYGAW